MKKFYFLMSLALTVLMVSPTFAQGRFGKDSANCVKYLSFYKEYMKQNNLKEAAPLWRKAIRSCPPSASQNMLLDGMKILRSDISHSMSNPIRKKELVDSLMLLHQLRIDTYPRYKNSALTYQAYDMINYISRDDPEKVYKVLSQTMDETKGKTSPTIIVRYMNFASQLYKSGKLTGEDVFSSFDKANNVLDQVEAVRSTASSTKARSDVENLFMQSGVADCDNLVKLFTPRYNEHPNDAALLGKVVSFLSAAGCTDEELFLSAVESLYKTDPSYKSAYMLYKLYASKKEFDKAITYMNEAIAYPESDAALDGQYDLELATTLYKEAGKSPEAVQAAKKVADLNPELAGKAYFLIGTIWGSQKCSGNDVEKRAPYWVAVDYLVKAKKADSSLTTDANELIKKYSQYFPQQSDAFMYDVLDGNSYTVSCGGMRATTVVRTQR